MNHPLDMPVEAFANRLTGNGGRRAYFASTGNAARLLASSVDLAPIAEGIRAERDFDAHEAVFFEVGRESGALLSAFLHKTGRGQGAGGVRFWSYDSVGALVRDGLRLSRGMGRKNALAGLWWGGGKGVIARMPGANFRDPTYRTAVYRDFGGFISSLRGLYVTAEDVGTTPADMAEVFKTTRFTTCIPESAGGSGNPSPATARGVVCALEGALDHLGIGPLAGKSVVLQGGGNVGSSMIADLLERDVANVTVGDVNPDQCRALSERFAGAPVTVRIVDRDDVTLMREHCDVFSPNALGAILNPDTIPLLSCKIVCGAANNQLLDERRDGDAISLRGIVYVPDFVANRMGIVNCANEEFGTMPNDPLILRHFGRDWDNSVYVITRRILESAKERGISTTRAAEELADRLALDPHPMFPGRGSDILAALVAEGWHERGLRA